jgi:molybdopterin-containing oxidoreductase family membrane subunit
VSDLDKVESLPQDQRVLLRPLVKTTGWFWFWAAVMVAVALWGGFAYYLQLRHGLGRTGLNTPEYWGIYIICFVFFIGISHAGTLISAILRISNGCW